MSRNRNRFCHSTQNSYRVLCEIEADSLTQLACYVKPLHAEPNDHWQPSSLLSVP